MAYIVNDFVDNTRLFIPGSDDPNIVKSFEYEYDQHMKVNESGGMSDDVANNIEALTNAAKTVIKKRKPICDWKTSNKSFLKLYDTYTKLNIKNNKFFLKLYDKDLRGVDPFSLILPTEMQLKIFLECVINPWYWLREVCRIPVDGKPIEPGGGSEFLADRNNIASWYCYLNGIDHYDSKARQLGKTQNAVAQLNYAFHFGAMSSTMLFFSKDFPLAKQNLYRLKCQRDMLPKWMQMRIAFKDDGKLDKGQDNITTMRNPVTNNVIKVMPKATSQENAIKLGRGETSSFYWNDEFDFTNFNLEIMDAAAFAYSTARENAIKNKSLYGRILTSTPGYLSTTCGKDAEKYIDLMVKWNDHMLDDPINKVKALINSKRSNGFMYIEHTWKQLGKSLEWYDNQCKLVHYDGDKILREIELQRIQGNERSPFKKSSLVYIAQNKKEPIEKIDLLKNLQPISIYEKINKKITYILSIDPAEALARNNTAFVLINPHTEMIAAEFKSPYVSTPDFIKMCCTFLRDYCPKSMIVVENNKGRNVIERFEESPFRTHIWYDSDKITDNIVKNTDEYGALKQSAYQRRALGFNTNKKSREMLFEIIERFMEEDLDKVNTEYLVKDVACVQRKINGTIILGAGDDDEGEGHGDILMAYLIGLFVLYNAKNLEEFGIRPGASEPDLEVEDSRKQDRTTQKRKIKELLNTLPEHMQGIFKDFLKETDPVEESLKYQKQLQAARRKMDESQMSNSDYYTGIRGQEYIDPMEQEALWASTDKVIMDQYVRDNDNNDKEFNVSDWID